MRNPRSASDSTRCSVAAAALLCVLACAGKPPPPRIAIAADEEPISAWKASCGNPVRLTRDCSTWTGPTKKLRIGGAAIAIAANDDGTHVLVMVPDLKVGTGGYEVTRLANLGSQRAVDALGSAGIAVRHARPMISSGMLFGYLLELDGDGYAALVARDESTPAWR